MGEAKRRKKLDPNYGKISVPSDELVKNWLSRKELAFFREITSGGENIACDWGDNDSFQLARTWTQQSKQPFPAYGVAKGLLKSVKS